MAFTEDSATVVEEVFAFRLDKFFLETRNRSGPERLWKEYYMDPSHLLDDRESKRNPSSPDLEHKMKKECLRIDGWYNPGWVLEKKALLSTGYDQDLGLVESGKAGFRSGVNVFKAQEHEKQGWEMLSLEEALTSVEQMPQLPSTENVICILRKCRTLKSLAYTKRLYAYICKSGLEDHSSLGNYLIPMLVQVGSICDAQQVFNKLIDRNVYSWNYLMMAYIECGESQHALNLYQKMQEDYVYASKHTFVAILKACARLKHAARGREIHAEIAMKGLEGDLFVGSTLVDMYAKCGLLIEAREAFDKLPTRNEVSWNSLMAGYAEHGLGEKALSCLERMQLEGLVPNAVTFVCSLKACGGIGAIDKGRKIHAKIAREGLEGNLFVGSTLVDMYAKCGSLVEAQEAFDKLPVRNEVSWNAVMVGYAEHGLGEEVLNSLQKMQLEGLSPNAVTFSCSLKACGSTIAVDKGREIHTEIARKGLERDLVVGSTLVDMYAKCGMLTEAQEAIDKLPVRNEISWTALIAGYVGHGLCEEALNCLRQMRLEGVSPNSVTLSCSLKSCGRIGAIDKGREIHVEIAKKGLESDLFVGCTLVDMYVQCGSLAEAREVFDKLPVRDIVSWTALIAGYAEQGFGEEALNCFDKMQLEGLAPDAITFVCSLKACGSIGAIDKGRELHVEISTEGLERDLFVGNTLVDMYAECGALGEAGEIFNKLGVRDIVSWNALMTGYAQLGESQIVFHMLERLRGERINPDGVTFSIVLTVCSHTGLVDKGQKYFWAMSEGYGISPAIEHHTGMVDLLGRAGQLNEAIAMVKKMHFCPNLVVWHMVLGACRKWGNVELGRLAFEHAVELDEKDVTAYILISNIYGDDHMQKEEKKVAAAIRMEQESGKKPGQSWWTDIGWIMHSLWGDSKPSYSKNTYAKLEGVSLQLGLC